MARIMALEAFYGGSHRAFLEGWARHSRHRFELLTMPDRNWQWRMRSSALTLGRRAAERRGEFDVLFATDFVDLSVLTGVFAGALADVPRLAYFHENQLTYPVPEGRRRNVDFGLANAATCLAADRVLFNTRFHLESFLQGLSAMLDRMPDHVPRWMPREIREHSDVVPVGVALADIDRQRTDAAPRKGPLRILWNHRWEYDKDPGTFFEVMEELDADGCEFRLAVTGQEAGGRRTAPFRHARERLGHRFDHFGYVPSREQYCRLLCECDVVVSTALQEFFGISVVEATYAGCLPLLPNLLSYPELLPAEWHAECLYGNRSDLLARLHMLAEDPERARRADLAGSMRRFGWDSVAPRLDAVVDELTTGAGPA